MRPAAGRTRAQTRILFTRRNCCRLTAFELLSLNIPATMLCDSMVGSLFQHHKIHAVGAWNVGAARWAYELM